MKDKISIIYDEIEEQLKISFDCNQTHEAQAAFSFKLHPTSDKPAATTTKDTSSQSVAAAANDTNEAAQEFHIKVWRYLGCVIVQFGQQDFAVYAPGCGLVRKSCANLATALAAAKKFIDKKDAQNLPSSSKPRM